MSHVSLVREAGCNPAVAEFDPQMRLHRPVVQRTGRHPPKVRMRVRLAPGRQRVSRYGAAGRRRTGRATRPRIGSIRNAPTDSGHTILVPYADPDAQREYQRRWVAARRAEWFAQNGPCVDCGTWENLELDHVSSVHKADNHVWSWRKERRDAELAKCVARCTSCHAAKSALEHPRGQGHCLAILPTEGIWELRRRVRAGEKQAAVGRDLGVSRGYVWDVLHRRTRKYE
jgi:hypothetical protein